MSIRHKIRKYELFVLLTSFDCRYGRITQNGVLKWQEHKMKAPLCLKVIELYRMDNFVEQSQNKNSWLY